MTPEKWQRVEYLFQAAIQEAPPKRAAFLAAADVEEDVRQEAASLVAAHEEATGFLSMPLATGAVEATRIYSFIGPYRTERQIGMGGMGIVYAALRTDEQFDKRVAVKVVRAGLESVSILNRFRSERQILAKLEHPNIACLLDGGITPDGLPYLVTELVEGLPLKEFCAVQNLSLDAKLDLFCKICSAVQYAHQRLVIHRDLKPGNILVNDAGEPKLLDFGIAKLLDPERTEYRGQTQTMQLLTPRYASPEQLMGAPLTTASDIYSLGVILYELLAGRHPFADALTTREALRNATLEKEPERPSYFQEKLAADLDNIALMALRKEPERRYRSAAQLVDDIRRFRANLPIHAHKETVLYVASKLIARHKLAACVAASIFIALISGLALMIYEAHLTEQERAEAEFIENFVKTTLAGADPTYNSPFANKGRDLRVADVLDIAVQRTRSELRNRPLLAAKLLTDLGEDYFRLGLYMEAEHVVSEATVNEEKFLGRNDPRTEASLDMLRKIRSASAKQ